MKTIILAAGKSPRMLPLTKDTNKCLLKVGSKTILEHQLDTLKAAGLTDITVITGFQPEKMENACKEAGVKTSFNPFYTVSGMSLGLWVAKEELMKGFDFRKNRTLVLTLASLLVLFLFAIQGMSTQDWVITLLRSLAVGSITFLVASGFSLIFGLMDVLNLAHGTLFMIGAYVGWTVLVRPDTFVDFLTPGALIGAGVALFYVLVIFAILWSPWIEDKELALFYLGISLGIIAAGAMIVGLTIALSRGQEEEK